MTKENFKKNLFEKKRDNLNLKYFEYIIGNNNNKINPDMIAELFRHINKKNNKKFKPEFPTHPEIDIYKKRTQEGITFDDVAGQDEALEAAKMLAAQLTNPEQFELFGVDCPKGILFSGPAGTGKTLIAKALANECGVPFMAIKASDVKSKWFGESTQNVKAAFETLREDLDKTGAKNSILYIDEIDALAPMRNEHTHDENRNVLSEILQQIDGFGTKQGIIVIASTNTPESVDKAFMSRMEMTIEVPLPDVEGIKKILILLFTKACIRAKRNMISADVNFDNIASHLIGFSGRDLESFVKTILRTKAQAELKKNNSSENPALLTEQDILEGIKMTGKINKVTSETRKKIGFTSDK